MSIRKCHFYAVLMRFHLEVSRGLPFPYCMFFFALVYVAVSVKLTTYAYRVAHKSKLQESKNFVDYFVLLCNCMYVAKCFVR